MPRLSFTLPSTTLRYPPRPTAASSSRQSGPDGSCHFTSHPHTFNDRHQASAGPPAARRRLLVLLQFCITIVTSYDNEFLRDKAKYRHETLSVESSGPCAANVTVAGSVTPSNSSSCQVLHPQLPEAPTALQDHAAS